MSVHPIRALGAVLFFLIAWDVVYACTCSPIPSPCAGFTGTPIVFVGLVKSIEEEKTTVLRFGKRETIRTGLTANFAIEESLKGISSDTAKVVTGGGHGDCGYDFEPNQRYLVFAYPTLSGSLGKTMSMTVLAPSKKTFKQSNVLSTSICTRTRPLTEGQDDLLALRAFLKREPYTKVFGVISRYARAPGTYEFNTDYVGPMKGIKVAVAGEQGLTTTTDDHGRYQFAGLRPGKYKLSVELPDGYSSLYSFERLSWEFEVTPQSCGLEFGFNVQLDGRISGRIIGADDKPVPDSAQVSVVTLASADRDFAHSESRSAYTKNGHYEIDGLPPGLYVLGVNIADPPEGGSAYPPTYFPGVSDLKSATIIKIGEGEKLGNYDLQLPPRLETVSVTGKVVWPNGQPVIGADIDISDAGDIDYSLSFGVDVVTDKQGRFSIRAFKGRKYFLHAYKDKDYFAGTGRQSVFLPIDTNQPVPPVRLVLNKPGIFRAGSRQ